jgi:hypothetical protein
MTFVDKCNALPIFGPSKLQTLNETRQLQTIEREKEGKPVVYLLALFENEMLIW